MIGLYNNFRKKDIRAFTLIEVLLTIGLVAASVAFAVPVASSLVGENRVINDASSLNSNLFRYQQYSYSRRDNATYGMCLNESGYTMIVFDDTVTADDMANRNTALDQEFELDNSVSLSWTGGPTITGCDSSSLALIFEKGSFKTSSTIPSLTLSDGSTDIILEINSEGLIDYHF